MPYLPEKRRLVNQFRWAHEGRYPTPEERTCLFGEEANNGGALPINQGSSTPTTEEHTPASPGERAPLNQGSSTPTTGEHTPASPGERAPLNQGSSTPPSGEQSRTRTHAHARERKRTHKWNIWGGFL
jgi:hypothetical protein